MTVQNWQAALREAFKASPGAFTTAGDVHKVVMAASPNRPKTAELQPFMLAEFGVLITKKKIDGTKTRGYENLGKKTTSTKTGGGE